MVRFQGLSLSELSLLCGPFSTVLRGQPICGSDKNPAEFPPKFPPKFPPQNPKKIHRRASAGAQGEPKRKALRLKKSLGTPAGCLHGTPGGRISCRLLLWGARLRGRTATQHSKKGSEKGACYGFYSKKGFSEGVLRRQFPEGVLRRQFPEGAWNAPFRSAPP